MQGVLPFDVIGVLGRLVPRGPGSQVPRTLPPAPTPDLGPRPHVDAQGSGVLLVRNPRARRYLIRVTPAGIVRVTIPRHGSKREALAFLESQRSWVDRQRARIAARPDRTVWRDGTTVWVRGERVPLRVHEDAGSRTVALAAHAIEVPRGVSCLKEVTQAHLRRLAAAELPDQLRARAARHDLAARVRRVSVRDQRSRWGSCSPSGTITLNWRLIQTPPEVCDYVLVHELMHLCQANHSARFWKLVAGACPDFERHRRWLREFGPELM
ncbi:MAG: SprT family zinc-dependent metalloprotease [Vicinamibacterales bacterium]